MSADHYNAAPVPPEQGAANAEELAYRLRQQQLTADFGLLALKNHDAALLLQEATRLCAEGMSTLLCKVMAFQPQQGDFLMIAGVGWEPGYVGHARAGADLESPAGFAFQTRRAVISNHLQAEARFPTPRILADHNVKRAINVVLLVADEPYGVLEVDSPLDGRFTDADLAFMQGFANLLGVALERQSYEDALRANEEQLRHALEHQHVLMQEVSHRVKNSLAIVAGLLRVQSNNSPSAELRQALGDAETRVLTIAQLHGRLWQTGEVRSLNLEDFLRELCEKFSSSASTKILTYEAPPVMIPTDDAIPLGLLVNELVTNAVKYASPQKPGDVSISIKPTGDRLRLEVRDHGPGLPEDWQQRKPASLGMKLISRLSRQLGGEPQWENALPGSLFTLEFSA
ncbi:sensor histidine kinase [Pseudomonas sp. W5-36]|uniref:sensor histidine kinase n=1 Tax=Pseudomonas sp. W5-36 TaxID=3097455 RepID=UPI00397CB16B